MLSVQRDLRVMSSSPALTVEFTLKNYNKNYKFFKVNKQTNKHGSPDVPVRHLLLLLHEVLLTGTPTGPFSQRNQFISPSQLSCLGSGMNVSPS